MLTVDKDIVLVKMFKAIVDYDMFQTFTGMTGKWVCNCCLSASFFEDYNYICFLTGRRHFPVAQAFSEDDPWEWCSFVNTLF